jgi:hypothetical protein
MAQKTEVSGIYKVRDGILINKDNEALQAYKRKKLRENNINEIEIIKDNIQSLKSDLEEIKNLLRSLVK